ncbi:Pentatricopeptide repeat-containing protein [Diplonema papillatum]|nr:Pentatricopeptide repeat-containing protein [Diplonema papillatum]
MRRVVRVLCRRPLAVTVRRMTDAMAALWLSNLKPQNLRGIRDEDSTKGDYVVELVKNEMQLLKDEGWELGSKAYTSAISIVGRYGKSDVAQGLFDEMVESGVRPTRLVYNSLLFSYVNSRSDKEGERFLSIFEKMEAECDEPADSATVAAVLHGLAKRGKHRDAVKAAEVFRAQGIPLTQHAYNILISSCLDVQSARGIYRQMLADGYQPDEVTFGSILKACSQTGDVESAKEVMADLKQHFHPTVREWTGYLTVFKVAGDMAGAQGAWDEMLEANVQPNSVSYGTMIRVHCDALKETAKREHAEAAGKLFERAVQENAVTSSQLVTVMMEIFAEVKDADGARKLLGFARAKNLGLTGYCKKYFTEATGERLR